MDLKISDVASLLNLSEETIIAWLQQGKLPSYQIDDQVRFSREEIEDWVLQHKLELGEEAHANFGNMHYGLYRALYRGEILQHVEAKTKRDVIAHTMDHMAEKFDLDAAVLTDLFLDREQMMSTSLGHGFAVPHTRDFLLKTHYDLITIVHPKEPIDYDALDGNPVHTLFFLFACEDTHHLHLLAKLAHLVAHDETCAFLTSRPSKETLLPYIKKWESSLNH